jgi:hypothetical protein
MNKLIFASLLWSCIATATGVWKVPKNDVGAPPSSLSKKLNFPEATLVQHPLFAIQISKSWSCGQSLDSRAESLTCAPSENIESSSTFLTFARRFGQTTHTLEGSYQQLKKNTKRSTSKKTINGVVWVYSTQEIDDAQKIKEWTVTSIKSGVEFIIVISVPISELSKYQSAVDSMLNSVKLN